jgi:hypothetical protein
MHTDGLLTDSPSGGKYVVRLGRAAAMLGLGVLMHLPSPTEPGAQPAVSPRPFVKVSAQQTDSTDGPAVIVTHSLVYAGSSNLDGVLEASRRAAPVGTAGDAGSTAVALAEFQPPNAHATDSAIDASPATPIETTAAPEPQRPAPVRPLPAVAMPPASGPTDSSPQAFITPAMVAAPALTSVRPTESASRSVSEEEELVRRLLDEYTGAFERRDVRAQKALYPTVDSKALKRRYEQITAQRLTLESCGITISGSTANARCRGSATFQPRIGTRVLEYASREWTFDLSKQDTAWRIVNTYVR